MRFLSAQAPPLPLEQCTQATACRCTYRKQPNRREDARRAEDATGTGTSERSEKAKKWLPGIQIDLASCPAKEKWRP
jgi:hypothetical protein